MFDLGWYYLMGAAPLSGRLGSGKKKNSSKIEERTNKEKTAVEQKDFLLLSGGVIIFTFRGLFITSGDRVRRSKKQALRIEGPWRTRVTHHQRHIDAKYWK